MPAWTDIIDDLGRQNPQEAMQWLDRQLQSFTTPLTPKFISPKMTSEKPRSRSPTWSHRAMFFREKCKGHDKLSGFPGPIGAAQ